MAPTRDDILKVCETLAVEENLRVTVSEAGKGALIAGTGAFVGGLLGGPVGLAIGGSSAACYAAVKYRGKFKSVVEVIMNDMTERQKQRLADSILQILSSIQAQDVIMLLTMISADLTLRELIIREMSKFIMNELNLRIAA